MRSCPNKNDNRWRKIHPKKGEKHKKYLTGLLYKWCGNCSEWMNQVTQDHSNDAQALQAQASPMPIAGGLCSSLSLDW